MYPVYTVSDLVSLTGSPRHRVRYALDSRNIPPVRRAGNHFLYDDDSLRRVRDALSEMDRFMASRPIRNPRRIRR